MTSLRYWEEDDEYVDDRITDGPGRVYDDQPTEPLEPAFPLGFAPTRILMLEDAEAEPLLWEGDQA